MEELANLMTDLLFEVAETKERVDEINRMSAQFGDQNGDFQTFLNPMMGKIEMKLVAALDAFFKEYAGLNSMAEHALYETGIITCDGIEYNIRYRDDFNNLIKNCRAKP